MEGFETEQLNDTLKHETAASFLSAPAFLFLASTDDIFLLLEIVPFPIKQHFCYQLLKSLKQKVSLNAG